MPGKELARGYTTGTCAQAAARAALKLLFGGKGAEVPGNVTVELPGGSHLTLPVEDTDVRWPEEGGRLPLQVSCAVRKDSGDDPDVTNGILIYTTVRRTGNPGIVLEGGAGVGRVTRPGLEQPVGSPAINQVPRRMILGEAEAACEEAGYEGGLVICISIPEGERLAEKTFNPRLGIEGGLSILGTTGIVEPMSRQALIETIRLDIRVKRAAGAAFLILAPGNYGLDFLEENYGIQPSEAVKCSNYIGEALDMAREEGCKGLILAGHIGKLIKVAGGIMDTHSRQADCRMELLAAAALRRELLGCEAAARAQEQIRRRVGEEIPAGVILFSSQYGILGQSSQAEILLEQYLQDRKKSGRKI